MQPTVENAEACPRYAGLTVRGVKVQESPKWLKDLLLAVGQRPINNIVDITNYILLGTGQPMHCFDLSKVKGDRIVVRTVQPGTKFVTLDGVERTLTDRDLMICNTEEPMCIGGVFGGLDSGVTEETRRCHRPKQLLHQVLRTQDKAQVTGAVAKNHAALLYSRSFDILIKHDSISSFITHASTV